MKLRITILMASQYGYGPELSSEEKKNFVEEDINRKIEHLKSDFDVDCKIGGGAINEFGKLEFNEESWNKIYNAEMLDYFVCRGVLSKDENNIFTLLKTKEEAQEMMHQKHFEVLNNLFVGDANSYDGRDVMNFFEQNLDERIAYFIDAIEDPKCDIIFNNGGGNISTDYLLPKLDKQVKEKVINATKTAIIGFSDGTTLPFYLIDKIPNVTLIQASGIHDFDYLKGERNVEIALQPIGNVVAQNKNIEGDVVAVSLHTSYHQMMEKGYVDKNLFDGKVVMLESSRDGRWKEKINEMIENGVFDNSKAIILGEFSQAIEGDILRNHASRDLDRNSLISNLKESFFENFAQKIQLRNPEIPLYKGAEGHQIFGHGARKCDYISCSKCEITPENRFISENVIGKINHDIEILDENMKIERPESSVGNIINISRLDGKNIFQEEKTP